MARLNITKVEPEVAWRFKALAFERRVTHAQLLAELLGDATPAPAVEKAARIRWGKS